MLLTSLTMIMLQMIQTARSWKTTERFGYTCFESDQLFYFILNLPWTLKEKEFTFCNFSHINVSFFVLFSQIIQISQQNLFSLASNTKFLHILKTLNKSWMSLADLSQWWQCCVWFFSQQFVLLAPHLSWVSASVSHKKHSILNNQTQTEQNMSVLSRSNINHSNQLHQLPTKQFLIHQIQWL